MTSFNEYQRQAESTAVFTHSFYPKASLMIEAAELADLFTKPDLRGDTTFIDRKEVISEAGDVLWNLAVLLAQRDIPLQEVADYNLAKLRDRQERGVLKGSGGDR